MKINYEILMEQQLKEIEKTGIKPKLLLHSCCAPCSSAILEFLQNYFDITVYFYNPNITFEEEYYKRLNEQREYHEKRGYSIKVIEGNYNPKEDFFKQVKGLEDRKEGGERCFKCYTLRMEATAQKAKELGFDYFSTVLSISPLKNAQWINEIGEKLSEKYGIKFLNGDFKKKNRYLRSTEISREYELYRQDYCGCVFSKMEREAKEKEKLTGGRE
ncbi:epoxyqueuosine reductase QueH [uncultured Fusobacterium sp.]|uniref:epoxyqueuosine reductase QueH n=1 Tax=uncultured Fusobacterium sp. TaxID=159267 RepID=UPI00280479E9|nr:epoxyqueuosine reductase QueH [uncultured Fusobacterium sp.]